MVHGPLACIEASEHWLLELCEPDWRRRRAGIPPPRLTSANATKPARTPTATMSSGTSRRPSSGITWRQRMTIPAPSTILIVTRGTRPRPIGRPPMPASARPKSSSMTITRLPPSSAARQPTRVMATPRTRWPSSITTAVGWTRSGRRRRIGAESGGAGKLKARRSCWRGLKRAKFPMRPPPPRRPWNAKSFFLTRGRRAPGKRNAPQRGGWGA
jgi:hypothetical protein